MPNVDQSSVKVAIVGSTGYGGVELIRLLHNHPTAHVTSVISSSSAGQLVTEGFPHLQNVMTGTLDAVDVSLIRDKADVVFTATPAGVSAQLAPQFLDAGLKVIDISGDFRIRDRAEYERWYKREPAQRYLEQAVYGLADIDAYAKEVKGQALISNPGCYPTATLLGLIPAVEAGWIDVDTLIIDAKSGVSGAGRGLSQAFHYAEINENFLAYKVNQHQHIPEIEQVLSDVAGRSVVTTFTTHLVPMTRGILSTMYATQTEGRTVNDWIDLYRSYYEKKSFVRIRPEGKWPATKEVWGSNYCDIGFAVDERTGRVTILSVIDNLVKGASGQAIQNLNLMMGWDETTGLNFLPAYP